MSFMINKDLDVKESFNMGHYLNQMDKNNTDTKPTDNKPNDGGMRESMNFQIPSFQPGLSFQPNPNTNVVDKSYNMSGKYYLFVIHYNYRVFTHLNLFLTLKLIS